MDTRLTDAQKRKAEEAAFLADSFKCAPEKMTRDWLIQKVYELTEQLAEKRRLASRAPRDVEKAAEAAYTRFMVVAAHGRPLEPQEQWEAIPAARRNDWMDAVEAAAPFLQEREGAQADNPLYRKAAWRRITWDCEREDFLAWRPSEHAPWIEVLTYNYAMLQLPSGDGLFSVVRALITARAKESK